MARGPGDLRLAANPLTSAAGMDVRDFDFDLPPELIAQEPPASRGGARLLHLDRVTGSITPPPSPARRDAYARVLSSWSTTRASSRRASSPAAIRAAAPSNASWSLGSST